MRAILSALMVALAGGCAQLGPLLQPDAEFELAGRLAARYGEEAFSANLAWRHGERFDEMLISTTLGAGVARIVRQGGEVMLTTAEPREYRASDAEALTEEVLGFRVPLVGLADWVRARPAAGAPARTFYGDDGRLRLLEQLGWRIEYQEYVGELPARLRLAYPGIELRLAISQWR